MAKLQTSGEIKATEIQTALGGSNPISVSEYYKDVLGDTLVDNPDVNTNAYGFHPVTGDPISFSDMYGDASVSDFIISENQVDLNLRNYLINAGWDQDSQPRVTILENVYITSSVGRDANGNQTPAMVISGEYPNGLAIINNGYILGHGGEGGGLFNQAANLRDGSCAISITTPYVITIENNGFIAGGGGGGARSNGSGTGSVANSGGGGGAGGGNGGRGKANTGGKTHTGAGGAGASTPGSSGLNGSSASSDVQGRGGEAGGGGGGNKYAE